MFPFDYDRDYLQPEIEKGHRDPDLWIWYGSGRRIVGDEDEFLENEWR